MNLDITNQKNLSFLTRIATGGSILIIFLSLITIIGWQIHNSLLQSIIPGQTPTGRIEAIGFILLSTSLLLLLKSKNSFITHIVSILINVIVFFLTLSSFLGIFVLQWEKIAPNTLISFIVLSFSITFLQYKNPLVIMLAQVCALFTALIAFFGVIGYIYQVLVLYQFSSFPPMSLNTALAFSLLTIAILFTKPASGLLRIFMLTTPTSSLAFKIIIFLLTIPPFVGFLVMEGLQRGMYDTHMAIASLVIGNIAIFAFLLWAHTYRLQKLEIEQLLIMEELKKKNIQLETNAKQLSEKMVQAEMTKNEEEEKKAHERMLIHASEV